MKTKKLKKKYTEEQLYKIYEWGFDALMNGNSKHDLAVMFWDTLTKKEKIAYGEE